MVLKVGPFCEAACKKYSVKDSFAQRITKLGRAQGPYIFIIFKRVNNIIYPSLLYVYRYIR